MSDVVSRFGILDELRKLAKKGASIEASVITTYSLNALFYEEVLLRALERAGSRLNILLVDSRQLAIAFQDPITRPRRAGRDYLLIPVDAGGAFHPKIAVLFSPKKPLIAIGSHNATESGYARNDEVTVCWGHQSNGVPREILDASVAFILDWVRTSPGPIELIGEVEQRLMRVSDETASAPSESTAFIGWRPRGPSMLYQLNQRVVGRVNRISIVSPYFDDNLAFLQELASLWSPEEIVVGIQSQSALLLHPERAPSTTRFVEFSAPAAAEISDDQKQPPFLHGKVIALQTDARLFVVVGSANASAPAWLQGEFADGNAEAAIVLSGELARSAFDVLGLDQLATAPSLTAAALDAVVGRSQEIRRLTGLDSAPSIPMLSASATAHGWFLPGLQAKDCQSAILLGHPDRAILEAAFRPLDGGVELLTGSQAINGGSLRIEGAKGSLAFAILNDAPHLRKLLRPPEAGRLLDALGRIDDYEGFDDLFDLFERHVLNEERGSGQVRSRLVQPKYRESARDEHKTPGPRGISLASLVATANERPQLEKEDYISDFLKALIRDLAPPPILNEGDLPDIDEEERGQSRREAKTAAGPSLPPGEWERLVTACRQRIGVLIGRLSKRLETLPTGPDAAAALAGKVLTVMYLLQKLRMMQPPEGSAPSASRRPESLVAATQVRSAFKAVIRAMYTSGGLAKTLEDSRQLRGSEDRRLLDVVMLWAAREIGVDFDAGAAFNEDPQSALSRDQDRVDGLVAAISAAAHLGPQDRAVDLPVRPWADAPKLGVGWMDRHIALGSAFQAKLTSGELPTMRRPVVARDIVIWRKEPQFPRLVADLSPRRASLLEPGHEASSEPVRVHPDYLLALDFVQLRADTTPQDVPV